MVWGSAAGAAILLGAIAAAPFALIFAVVLAIAAVAWFIKLLGEAIGGSASLIKWLSNGPRKKPEIERPVQPAHDERFKADYMRRVREATRAKEKGEKPADKQTTDEPRPEDKADWWKKAS